ncbi:MAG: hypothetical protein KJ808_09805 [Acidobacteria bacterium]|nr:hypothetical protein [Acidobacteriota bacterium]MBU4306883.1 hypothetical protein [Acidobacteriota bacterium]MCG2810297.1 hypothetical protein [Candidatus Aminicenantes bacterium]
MTTLSKKQILRYLEELSTELGKKNLKGEILLFGGAAGFEWDTGFYINPVSPEESVQALKAI